MEYPMHEGDIRLLHPEIGDEFVCPEEFALLHNSPFPEFDPEVKKFENGTPENIDGVWYRTWVLKDMTAEEIVKRKEALELAADPVKYEQFMSGQIIPVDTSLNNEGTEPDVIG
jgi:hypothetical protein